MIQTQYKPQYFYFDSGAKVELMEVGRIASFAVTLEPKNEIREIDGYTAALYDYMINNKDNILFNSYLLLNSDSLGKSLLSSNIGLCLLEKSFREEGASEDSIKVYASFVNEYHKIINYNKEKYDTKNKSL